MLRFAVSSTACRGNTKSQLPEKMESFDIIESLGDANALEPMDKVEREYAQGPGPYYELTQLVEPIGSLSDLQNRNQIQMKEKTIYDWIEVASPKNTFTLVPRARTLLQYYSIAEEASYEKLMNDNLKHFVPAFYGICPTKENPKYVALENLPDLFNNPCILDCKMGRQTFLRRRDVGLGGMPIERYMAWQESKTTSALVGFRIEGIRMNGVECLKNFRTVDTWGKVKDTFRKFMNEFSGVRVKYLETLTALRAVLPTSEFFCSHDLIGTSLLFVHDKDYDGIWLVDFGQTFQKRYDGQRHSTGITYNAGQGYIFGLDNLIGLLEEIGNECN